MRLCLSMLLLLTILSTVSGQEFSYVNYDSKDGLAGSVVYCAAEDKEGFLWFGTETGLSRFDGTHFRNFTTADGLPDNEILHLFTDSRGRVWIMPFQHSVCYYWKGKIHNQENDSLLHRLSFGSEILSINEDSSGNIFIVESTSLHIISRDEKIKKITHINDSLVMFPIGGGISFDNTYNFGTLGIVPAPFYTLYNLNKGVLKPVGKRSFFAGTTVNSTLWSPKLNGYSNDKQLLFSPTGGKEFSLPLPEHLVTMAQLDDSLFALNTTDGTLLYNLQTKTVSGHFLHGHTITAVIRDSEANLWFACAGGGIFRLGSRAFRSFRFQDNGNDLPVCSIRQLGKSLLIGTEKYLLWSVDLPSWKMHQQKVNGNEKNRGRISSIQPIDKDNLLLATDGGIIKLTHFIKSGETFDIAVKSLTVNGNEYLVSSHRMVFTFHPSDLRTLKRLWEGRSTCSYKKDSVLYIGTLNGLYILTSGKQVLFPGNTYPIFKSRITDIKEGRDGLVWIATYGGGVAGYRDKQLLYTLTEKDGLSSDICRNIYIAGEDLWVGTEKGLNRVQKQGDHFRITTFTSADGLGSDIINAVYVDDKKVYAGTARGMTCFNTGEAESPSFCKLRITAVRAGGHVWNYDTSNLLLPHHENSLQVEFAGISYRSAGDILYKYRLRGLSDDWQTTRETFVSYPTLPSGEYELELTATNRFGVQSGMVRIEFVVEKLLWEKKWFIFLSIAVVCGTLWFLISLRARKLNRQNQIKSDTSNRMAELEQMALKAQMNPHFIFNSLNSIQKYVITKDLRGANKFISDFSRLMRLTLEISSKSKISLDEEVNYLRTYLELERVRFENKFQYVIEVDPALDRSEYCIPPMILQPFVENSIRHGVRYRDDNRGLITVSFMKKDAYLVCVVGDNGLGRKLAEQFKSRTPMEYQSRGMALTERRMEMMNKTQTMPASIKIEDLETGDHQPAGTRITLHFPLRRIINLNL